MSAGHGGVPHLRSIVYDSASDIRAPHLRSTVYESASDVSALVSAPRARRLHSDWIEYDGRLARRLSACSRTIVRKCKIAPTTAYSSISIALGNTTTTTAIGLGAVVKETQQHRENNDSEEKPEENSECDGPEEDLGEEVRVRERKQHHRQPR